MSVFADESQRICGHRVLVLDADPVLQLDVGRALEERGFEVSAAFSIRSAFDHMERYGYPDVALVDLDHPKSDGWAFCKTVNRRIDLPLIALSADHDSDTAVRALESYADDYVRKPFSAPELATRTTTLLRRIGDLSYTAESRVRVDERLEVDFERRVAIVDGCRHRLTPTESRLLFVLIRNAGRTVQTSFLLRRLWPLEEVYEDSLRSHMYRLRKKIERDSKRPEYIGNVRGLGYRFLVTPPRPERGLRDDLESGATEPAGRPRARQEIRVAG